MEPADSLRRHRCQLSNTVQAHRPGRIVRGDVLTWRTLEWRHEGRSCSHIHANDHQRTVDQSCDRALPPANCARLLSSDGDPRTIKRSSELKTLSPAGVMT